MESPGVIVILNGAPRSGKSSIAAVIQETFDGPWMNIGVDRVMTMTPRRYLPGIGLRPGGERPDLEPFVKASYAAMYESVGAHSRAGLNVVVDVGHHEAHSVPLGTLTDAAGRLRGLPAFLIGVRCPVEVIMERRNAGQPGREGMYEQSSADRPVPPQVALWQREVHIPGIYDLDVDTSVMSPSECAEAIRQRMAAGPPEALARILQTAPEASRSGSN